MTIMRPGDKVKLVNIVNIREVYSTEDQLHKRHLHLKLAEVGEISMALPNPVLPDSIS